MDSRVRDPQNFFTGEQIFRIQQRAQEFVIPGERDSSDTLASLLNEKIREALGPKVSGIEREGLWHTSGVLPIDRFQGLLFCVREVGPQEKPTGRTIICSHDPLETDTNQPID